MCFTPCALCRFNVGLPILSVPGKASTHLVKVGLWKIFTRKELFTGELFAFDKLDDANAVSVPHCSHNHAKRRTCFTFTVAGKQ